MTGTLNDVMDEMPNDTLEHVDLQLTGMTCAACAGRIEKKLNRLEGVTATVNYATERATIAFEPTTADTAKLIATVQSIGYDAALPSVIDDPDNDPAVKRLAIPHLAMGRARSSNAGRGLVGMAVPSRRVAQSSAGGSEHGHAHRCRGHRCVWLEPLRTSCNTGWRSRNDDADVVGT